MYRRSAKPVARRKCNGCAYPLPLPRGGTQASIHSMEAVEGSNAGSAPRGTMGSTKKVLRTRTGSGSHGGSGAPWQSSRERPRVQCSLPGMYMSLVSAEEEYRG